jgi:hypothetical protein
MRQGDWMQTFTGRKFWPIDPRAHEIDIVDIAHALSLQCRFAGHCLKFYSVAEHCVLLSQHVSKPNALWALLHDAAKAYLTDIPRPLKSSLPQYKQYEQVLMHEICIALNLDLPEPSEVTLADTAILTDEARQNMSVPPEEWSTHGNGLGAVLQFWYPPRAEVEFLRAYEALRK